MPELAEVRFKENYKVTVHRRFAEATFDTPLSVYEQRILYAALSNIEPPEFEKDENNNFVLDENGDKIIVNYLSEFPIFEMRLKEFGELIGLKEIDYRHIKKIMRDFKKKGLEIHRLDRPENEIHEKDYRGINFLLESEYLHNEGIVRLEFSPKLLPYVANLKGEFVSVPLNVITSFTSKYSTKLYFLLQQWSNFKLKEIEVDELKALMGVPYETKYESGKPKKIFKLDIYANFKNRALLPAINEINKFSTLNIGFEEVKKGKRVGKIKFFIGREENTKLPKQGSFVNPQKKSISLHEYLAREVFDGFNFQTMFFKNTAKSLEGVPNLDSDRDLELKVYSALTDLKEYFKRHNHLNEGFLIKSIREMVVAFNEQGNFSFQNGFVRTEITPEWSDKFETIKNLRLEFEQNQSFTVLRKEPLPKPEITGSNAPEAPSEDDARDFEKEKQKLLEDMKLKKAKLKLESKYGKKD